jgi:hypothetical protein
MHTGDGGGERHLMYPLKILQKIWSKKGKKTKKIEDPLFSHNHPQYPPPLTRISLI